MTALADVSTESRVEATEPADQSYGEGTASTQPDPEALHQHGDVASESFLQAFPIEDARCATTPVDADWVPDRERPVVPDEVMAVCRRCDGRAQCLLWALNNHEVGYWAGTTSTDRDRMRDAGRDDVAAADELQDAERAREGDRTPKHAPGEGSFWWYRKGGCRCDECRQAHSAKRAEERAARSDSSSEATAA
jgi:hypothetical protein